MSADSEGAAGPGEIARWRRRQRTALRARRMGLAASPRAAHSAAILDTLRDLLATGSRSVGLYCPFRGEVDLLGLAADLAARQVPTALPVVVEREAPLEFWAWRPGEPLVPGVWRIPIPVERQLIDPELLLVPLVGFDELGFRLGNGGGYYDRTLAARRPRPATIGVGFELGRLDTIFPQPHDVPLDALVTERGVRRAVPGCGQTLRLEPSRDL